MISIKILFIDDEESNQAEALKNQIIINNPQLFNDRMSNIIAIYQAMQSEL